MKHRLARFVATRPASSLRPSIQCKRHHQYYARSLSTAPKSNEPATASLKISDLKTRIGKCIMFGLDHTQTKEACSLLEAIALQWRELVAGSEGFLTGRDRMGLFRQAVVWGEMDSMGHVNNVVYNRYAESARVNWTLNFANAIDPAHKTEWRELVTPASVGLILRSIRTDYKFPLTWPDHVTVLHKLRSEPKPDTDHFILDVVILSELHRRPAARCVEDIVVYDYKQARKSPLKPFMVEKFREAWVLQEQAKAEYSKRAAELIRRVRELERSSWDRPDAKEDLGGAVNR